ncbi:MAG TPA: hypothetical protein VKI62_00760, partial [Bacteroidota bacterium]|nr:hypothetical protein [Bacteroidota bacterium]
MDKNKSVQVSGGTPMQTEQRSLPPIGQSTPTGFQFQPRSETVPTQLSPVTQTEKPFSLSSATPDQMAKVYDIAGGSAGDVLGALSSRDAASQKLQQEMAMKEIESKLTEQREMNVAAPRNAMEQRRIDSEDSFRKTQEQDRVSQELERTRHNRAEEGHWGAEDAIKRGNAAKTDKIKSRIAALTA